MQSDIIIAVDIGTTSTKALAYDRKGKIWAEEEKGYPLYSPVPTKKEQDADEIYQAVKWTLANVASQVANQDGRVAGVGFSAAMHSLLAVDENGSLLTNVITWADQRSVEEAEALKKGDGHEIYLRTGTPIHPMSPLTKLLWFKNNEPDIFNKAAKWISIKEYIFYQLFHRYVVDYSIASATGLFHLANSDWDKGALETAGITEEQLSRPVSTSHVMKGLDSTVAESLHLAPDTPFVVGASDGVLANIGVGAVEEGSVACTIGTSGAIRTVVDRPSVDPKGRIFCYALTEDRWVIGGPINNGGIAFRWARDELFADISEAVSSGEVYNLLTAKAEKVRPGADGLLFLPYLTGERAPFWNADTKGMFFGLTLNHGREHMVRSVLEGVMFQMYSVVIALIEAGVEPFEYRAGGGFARSELWRQIMADVFEAEIVVPESHQNSCLGAAWLTMKALGMVDDLASIKQVIHTKVKHGPIDENLPVYRELKPIFLRLARQMQDEFKAISDFQRRHGHGDDTLSTNMK
ncbi:gluconokinase [Thalassobacillus pellis]|uniref:gluconokinase n=1 Tax=Thalassobacillus pellis TaxID=748008 RepID=UPI00196001AA|nr:gluconokinase [Thalassobacillus pellis]MBM7551716.1 gluconokinase [Thalassobacillus pellis]